MRQSDRKKCEKIIHTSSVAASVIGADLTQASIDSVEFLPIQTSMIIQLAEVFQKKISMETAKDILHKKIKNAEEHAEKSLKNLSMIPDSPMIPKSVQKNALIIFHLGWDIANDLDHNIL